jgi:hypothetical protein
MHMRQDGNITLEAVEVLSLLAVDVKKMGSAPSV